METARGLDKTASTIVNHYSQSDEQNRLKHDIGPLEEARMHLLFQRYLPPIPAAICDIGGAAGAHSFWLAAQGYTVSLADIVPLHIEQARGRQNEPDMAKLRDLVVADARDLPFPDESFDSVLMHGPLYHLVEATDRKRALSEARRVFKPNGKLLAVSITRYASLIFALTTGRIWDLDCLEMLKHGVETGLHKKGFSFKTDKAIDAYFHTPEQLNEEIKESGFDVRECIGVVGPVWLTDDFDENWNVPERRSILMEIAAWTEHEPVLGPRIMTIAQKEAL